MKFNTRQKLLNIAAALAVAVTAAAIAMPAAQAAPGTVTSNVNVRSGPGTNYPVVSTVRSGTQVDVQQCQGSWCYVVRSGLTGWVSSAYLAASGNPRPNNPGPQFPNNGGAGPGNQGSFPGNQGPRPGNPGNPPPYPGNNGNNGPFPGNQGPFPGNNQGGNGPSINLNIPGGPSISIGNGNQNQNPPPRPPIVQQPAYSSQVCFYDGSRFRGASTCLSSGDSSRDLGDWADRISSIDNPDGLNVQVCSEPNYKNCRTYTTSASSLNDFDDYIVSVRVR